MLPPSRRSFSLAALGVCLSASLASAEVHLNNLFAPHMVLQRDRPISVWGQAAAGEQVTVQFADTTQTATADASGKWMVVLPAQAASVEPRAMTVKGANELKVDDILVGDVYLGMGQSNMDYGTGGTTDADLVRHMPAAAFKNIRAFTVQQAVADQPVSQLSGQWTLADGESLQHFSAVLSYFGLELRSHIPDVPIGLIRASVGATNLYCWLPNEVRDNDPSSQYLRTWWPNSTQSWTAEGQSKRDAELANYEKKVAELKAQKIPVPADLKRPGELMGPKWSRRPSGLFNGMIAPLEPFSIRAMVWYQGEWDSKREWTLVYHDSFISFTKALREQWAAKAQQPKVEAFPIYIIQLPAREPVDGQYWPYLREVQQKLSVDVPESHLVVTYDTNDPNDLHPRTKRTVGQRLAWAVAANEYGRDLPWHGPQMKSITRSGNGLLIEFDPGDVALKSADGQPLRYFEVAGEDSVYHAASAEIRDNTVFVSAGEVTNPKNVRYAMMPAPTNPNFTNAAGLPAVPFRTDNQPLPEKNK